MRRPRLMSKFGWIGAMSVVVGGSLMGIAGLEAGATANPALTLKVVTSSAGTCSGLVCSGMAGGDVISVFGSGFSANQLASVLQCNDDPTQPQVFYLGNDIPVSCSRINIVATSGSGTFGPVNYTVKSGTVGPPAYPTPVCYLTGGSPTTTVPIAGCTTSGSAVTDATKYPCPPTTAQIAAGDACVIAVGDILGERAIGEVLFGSESEPPCGTSTTAGPNQVPCSTTTTGPTTTQGPTTSSTTSSTTTTEVPTTSTTATTATTSTTVPTTSSTTSTTTSTEPTTSSSTTSTSTTTSSTTSTEPTTSSSTTSSTPTSSTTSSTTSTLPPATLTGPYELYCPGTPIGDIVLNEATTSATISPASPAAGQTFTVTNYQTTVNIPATLAGAAAALSPTLAGSASTQLDVTGATPTTYPEGPFNFSQTYPSPIPAGGVPLQLPSTPGTAGPFTAGSGGITVQQDATANLTLIVSGTNLTLTCTAYTDNSNPTGILPSGTTPSGNAIDPVIALANGGGGTQTPTTTTTAAGGGGGTTTTSGGAGGGATTTAAPVTAASSSLAFTGPGVGTKLMALLGALLVLFGLVLLGVVDAPRRMLRSLAVLNPGLVRSKLQSHRPRVQLPKPKIRLPQLNFRMPQRELDVLVPRPSPHQPQPSLRWPPPSPQWPPPSEPVAEPKIEVVPPHAPAPQQDVRVVQPNVPAIQPNAPAIQPNAKMSQAPPAGPVAGVHPGQPVSGPVDRSRVTSQRAGRSSMRSARRGAEWLLGR